MSTLLTPTSVAEFAEAIRAHPAVLAIGAQTKPRLSAVNDAVVRLSTLKLSGIVEYEPDEYTFTARAGTRLSDLAATLAAKGQYLPFDPPLMGSGATLGGTVAAGLSGPGRFRYGGLRDFILGVQFIDGAGRTLRLGGKVVKNAAGFDLPKFFVGSLGRYGVLTELTLKVFPRPARALTLRLPVATTSAAVDILTTVGRSRWEAEAIDINPHGDAVLVRLAGPAESLSIIAQEIFKHWPGEILTDIGAKQIWHELAEFSWAEASNSLLKLAITPAQIPALLTATRQSGGRAHISAGGNLALVALPAGAEPTSLGLPALMLRGVGPLWSRAVLPRPTIFAAVKAALDPENRFPLDH